MYFSKAEDAKKAAEKSFEDCNEVARREVSYHGYSDYKQLKYWQYIYECLHCSHN